MIDFNFDIFGKKKNGPELEFYKWLCRGLQDIYKDVEDIKGNQANLNGRLETHLAVQKEQWKRGCPMSIGAMLIAIGSLLYSWIKLK